MSQQLLQEDSCDRRQGQHHQQKQQQRRDPSHPRPGSMSEALALVSTVPSSVVVSTTNTHEAGSNKPLVAVDAANKSNKQQHDAVYPDAKQESSTGGGGGGGRNHHGVSYDLEAALPSSASSPLVSGLVAPAPAPAPLEYSDSSDDGSGGGGGGGCRRDRKQSQHRVRGGLSFDDDKGQAMAMANLPPPQTGRKPSRSYHHVRVRSEKFDFKDEVTNSMRLVRFLSNGDTCRDSETERGDPDVADRSREAVEQQPRNHPRHAKHSKHSKHSRNSQRARHDRKEVSADQHKQGSWMTQIANAFRSPKQSNLIRKHTTGAGEVTHHSTSDSTREYPHKSSTPMEAATMTDAERPAHPVRAGGHRRTSKLMGWKKYGSDSRIAYHHDLMANQQNPDQQPSEEAPLLLLRDSSRPGKSTRTSIHWRKSDSIGTNSRRGQQEQRNGPSHNYVAIAASFLQDYEASRPPTLPADLDQITDRQIALFRLKFGYHSVWYSIVLAAATLALFISSFLEGFSDNDIHRYTLTALNLFSVAVFAMDMLIRYELHRETSLTGIGTRNPASIGATANGLISQELHHMDLLANHHRQHVSTRNSRAERLVKPMVFFCVVLGIENVARLVVTDDTLVLFSSLFKPLVLFYVSSQGRDALEALGRVLQIVIRVIMVELLVILMFAAVACRLFPGYGYFDDLSTAWLSLFELSTTVVNPSMWMPIYQNNRSAALFFIIYIVTAVFYLHSLVLSVVFNTYIQSASDIHQRSAVDREDAIRLAHLALQKCSDAASNNETSGRNESARQKHAVAVRWIRRTLRVIRPHYSPLKINALVEIMTPENQSYVEYATFRSKIRQVLNASIRTARLTTTLAIVTELMAVTVAVVNFIYVILVSSSFSADWFNPYENRIGIGITTMAAFELGIRFNPFRIRDFIPVTRLNAAFDGSALVAAMTSSVGMILYLVGKDYALEYILMGRAIDMIRIMRFFQIFRDVVRRSADVMPSLMGPIILVITTLHIFVYMGMTLWGGAIHVGTYEGLITPLYDLNNFNSYEQGVVTMFQVLVVNDWHAIAQVFHYADRWNSPLIVYPFFILGNLIGVSIMLNLLTAFFVNSFSTKIHDETNTSDESKNPHGVDFKIETSENTSIRRVASNVSGEDNGSEKGGDDGDGDDDKQSGDGLVGDNDMGSVNQNANDDDHDSLASSESELFEFDIFEREGLDKVMQSVIGTPSTEEFGKQICRYLEVFEGLAPGREPVGYLVCDQQTMERFGNRRFPIMAVGYLEETDLHWIVSDMNGELLALASLPTVEDKCLIRRFHHPTKMQEPLLEISASLIRRQPALSLFVLRHNQTRTAAPGPPPSGVGLPKHFCEANNAMSTD